MLRDEAGQPIDHLQIVYLGVDARFRGKGYAREILIDLLAEAEDRSPAPIVSLFVDSENQKACEIYQKPEFGFVRWPHVDERDPDSGVLYLAMYARIREVEGPAPPARGEGETTDGGNDL